ncbi:hypothetical protein OESDEN_21604 [Oesophagostomum dentatum]|uniref:Uncharacterized protein n=1 Tax=Oesophagostomum dentatum TaxID=61180 RepID=A0A0B1S5I9_OESDE|nr:hypothetical protein OESDEN_21604 [Oesophagostomum dentatum]
MEAHHKPPPPQSDTPMSISTTSMVTSLISPLNEKLCGIDEEISAKNEVC